MPYAPHPILDVARRAILQMPASPVGSALLTAISAWERRLRDQTDGFAQGDADLPFASLSQWRRERPGGGSYTLDEIAAGVPIPLPLTRSMQRYLAQYVRLIGGRPGWRYEHNRQRRVWIVPGLYPAAPAVPLRQLIDSGEDLV